MYDEPQTLIVVYKDELVLNQLKKFVETNDDAEDGSVTIVAWEEKMWLEQKNQERLTVRYCLLETLRGQTSLNLSLT